MCIDRGTGEYVACVHTTKTSMDMCMVMCIEMCMDMSMHMCMDMCMDMCTDMCIDMCIDVRIDAVIVSFSDMCAGIFDTHMCRRVYTHMTCVYTCVQKWV